MIKFLIGVIISIIGAVLVKWIFPYNLIISVAGGLIIGWNFRDFLEEIYDWWWD